MVAEPCRECGVLDALGRHAGDCPRALEMGLPRLADGEEPIDPIEPEDQPEPEPETEPEPKPQQGDPLLALARRRGIPVPEPVEPSLWMSYYHDSNSEHSFDAVIFDSEIEALRYAVIEHWQVKPLELRRSLLDQATPEAT